MLILAESGLLTAESWPLIDGVLQFDFPQSPLATAGGGPAPALIVGRENGLLGPPLERLLAASDLSEIADQFNPLALVGPAGSGKSLVAQGLARTWSQRLGVDAVAYYTAADFGRERQAAEAENRLDAWRDEVRAARLLVIEDLDRLRLRATIQRELREFVDRMIASGGVVVVTAVREPYLCSSLDPGLRDRLVAGLTVRIERPGLAARRAILAQAATVRGWQLNDEAIARLAEADCTTPSQLLGRLNASMAQHAEFSAPLSSTERGEGSDDSGGYALHSSPQIPRPASDGRASSVDAHARLKHIVAVAARYFGVTQAAITSKSRRSSLVEARNVIVYLTRRTTDLSYAEIGRVLGGRDHTTIMHADRRLAERLAVDPALEQSITELERLLM